MALTDSFLRSVHGKESSGIQEKTDRDGLSARISPKGKVVFQMRYRFSGKQKRVDIGTYPGMTLKEAREETIKLRRALDDGLDPSDFLASRVIENQRAYSVENVIREWYNIYALSNIKVSNQLIRTFEIYVFPVIGSLKHDSVPTKIWLELVDKVKKSSPSIAKRILAVSNQAHSWAIRRRMIKTAPLAGITNKDMGIKIGITNRVLTDDEIRLLFEVMRSSRMVRKNQLFVKLILLFGCRSGELVSAEVSHFDMANSLWTVPPENHKTGKSGKPLLRPIIPAAKEMIEEAMRLNGGSKMLFERAKSGHYPDRPMNSSSMLSVPKTFMSWALKHKGIIMPHWSLHDLRRTARTRWSSIAPPHVCEIMLGHKLPGVWAVYDHSGYIDEQREAYLAWWEEVERIVGDL